MSAARHFTKPKIALTHAEAVEILRLRASGMSCAAIADCQKRHVVSVRRVCRIGWEGWLIQREAAADRARRIRHPNLNQESVARETPDLTDVNGQDCFTSFESVEVIRQQAAASDHDEDTQQRRG